jgi:predicted RNA-binding protein with PIN domain
VPDPSLYLFDGYNLLHAGAFESRDELVDLLAGYVALRGARGVVVFDGHGEERDVGSLAVRFAAHADALLERLAAEHRSSEIVALVSSDAVLRGTSGQEVRKRSSAGFLAELEPARHEERRGTSRVDDRLDEETRAALERLRRGDE